MSIETLVGHQIGQYQLVELLGVGAMGAVYRAHQPALGRDVALKMLPSSLAAVPDHVARFNREAKIAASLEHPHIVPLHDYGTVDGISYVVMRLLTGGTLAERLNQRAAEQGPLPSLGETASMLRQVGSALDYAHRKGVVHRDIKPNNIMFDEQGTAYIVDFGIARLLNVNTEITSGLTVFGTPHYMPPEQWRDEKLTAETDQYALGVVIYSMVTGQPPFDAPTSHALMYKHFHEPPPPVESKRPDAPPNLDYTLRRALAKNPGDRYLTVMAFSQAFDAAIQGAGEPDTGFFTFPVEHHAPVIAPPLPAYDAADEPPQEAPTPVTEDTQERAAVVTVPSRPRPTVPSRQKAKNAAPSVPEMIPPAPPAPYTPFVTGAEVADVPVRRRSGPPPVLVGIGIALAIVALAICGVAALLASQRNIPDGNSSGVIGSNPTAASEATDSLNVLPTNVTIGPVATQIALSTSTPQSGGSIATQALPATSQSGENVSTQAALLLTPMELTPESVNTSASSPLPTNSVEIIPTMLPQPGAATNTFVPLPTTIQATQVANANIPVPANSGLPRIEVANARNLAQVVSLPHGTEPVRGVGFSPDGQTFATGAADGTIHFWTREGAELGAVSAGGGVLYDLAYSPDGTLLASAHENGNIYLWNASDASLVATLSGHNAPVRDLAFSPDGRYLASGGEDNTANVWDVNTHSLVQSMGDHPGRVLNVAFSPDGTLLATACEDGFARIWDVATGEEVREIESGSSVRSVAFDPRGGQLATAGADGTIGLWDLASGTEIAALQGHNGEVWTLTYSPDGSLLASGGRDNTARLWNVNQQSQAAVLRGHGGWVLSLAFSADGSILATGSGDGTARLWEAS